MLAASDVTAVPEPSPDDDVIELRCTRLANGSVRWVGDYDDAVWPGDGVTIAVVPADRLAAVTRERDEARADANRLILEHQAFMQALSEALDVPWSSPEMFGTVRHPEEDEIVQWVGEEHAVALRSRRHARAALAGDTPDAPAGRLEDA